MPFSHSASVCCGEHKLKVFTDAPGNTEPLACSIEILVNAFVREKTVGNSLQRAIIGGRDAHRE